MVTTLIHLIRAAIIHTLQQHLLMSSILAFTSTSYDMRLVSNHQYSNWGVGLAFGRAYVKLGLGGSRVGTKSSTLLRSRHLLLSVPT